MIDAYITGIRRALLAAAMAVPAVAFGEPYPGDPATKLARPAPATPAAVAAVPDAAASAAGTVQATSAWVNCAKNSKTCRVTPTGLVTLRYGVGDSYTYVNLQGVQEFKCSDFWGDPEKGVDKFCDYTAQNLLGVSADSSFATVAGEKSEFSVPGEGLFWVRFGTGSSWIYTLIEGGSQQVMPCNKDYFGFDPAKKQTKECQVGAVYEAPVDGFAECATEGNTCAVGSSVVVARYGAGAGYDTRFVHQGDTDFPCNGNFFGNDPAKKQHKACAIQAMPAQNVETLGVWQKVTSCDGTDCPIEYRLVVGTSRTNSWTTTDQWSETVTTSVESGFEIEGASAKVTTSVSNSYAHSEAFTEALTESADQWFTATCDPSGSAQKRAIYQFRTDTDETCLESGTCSGSTQTAEYVCALNAPSDYAGPQCVPGYCSDALCTVCDYPGES